MRERAIVSDIPGTTRDTVEELMEIGGIPIHLVDTAGIRSGGDHIERLGVERSVRAMEQADLVLAVIDISKRWDEDDRRLVQGLDPARSIVVCNKVDLAKNIAGRVETLSGFLDVGEPGREDRNWQMSAVSALTGEGLEDLRASIQRGHQRGRRDTPGGARARERAAEGSRG